MTYMPSQAVKPRYDQERLSNSLIDILQREDHAYLEAPTGTGKTLTIGLTGHNFSDHHKVFLANTVDLVDQGHASLTYFGNQGLLDISGWSFMTWQSFVSFVKRDHLKSVIKDDRPMLIFVDECHMGGSVSPKERRSFAMIREAADKVVWVSATPWQLDECVLGRRADHTAFFSTADAYKGGLINDVDLIRVDCGLRLKVAIADFERREGRRFQSLAARDFSVEGSIADELLDKLEQYGPEHGLALRDVRTIISHRMRLMGSHYLRHHRGQKAIFWVPNQRHAIECAKYLSKGLSGSDRAEAIITDPSGSVAEAGYSAEALEQFRDPEGAVKVACVVYRLREGFDMPELRLGYDCAWNPYNFRATAQKIGRLTRVSEGKKPSAFHYAVDVKTVLGANADYNADFLAQLAASLTLEADEARDVADAIFENLSLRGAWSEQPMSPANVSRTLETLEGRQYQITKTPLFDILSANGAQEIERHTVSTMIAERGTRGDRLHEILDQLADGADWKAYPDNVRTNLLNAARPNQVLYLPSIRKRLAEVRPDLLPRTHKVRLQERIEQFNKMIDSLARGGDPSKLPLDMKQKLVAAANPRTRDYIPEIHQRLSFVCKDLVPTTMEELSRARIEKLNAIIDRLANGDELRSLSKNERTLISNAANPKTRQYLPDIRARLQNACPKAIPKPRNRTKQEQEASEGLKETMLHEDHSAQTKTIAAIVCGLSKQGRIPTVRPNARLSSSMTT